MELKPIKFQTLTCGQRFHFTTRIELDADVDNPTKAKHFNWLEGTSFVTNLPNQSYTLANEEHDVEGKLQKRIIKLFLSNMPDGWRIETGMTLVIYAAGHISIKESDGDEDVCKVEVYYVRAILLDQDNEVVGERDIINEAIAVSS